MLSCERLAKWRTTSGSGCSGKAGGAAARAVAGSNFSADCAGTSHSGRRCARRPDSESSNRSFVSRELRIIAFINRRDTESTEKILDRIYRIDWIKKYRIGC